MAQTPSVLIYSSNSYKFLTVASAKADFADWVPVHVDGLRNHCHEFIRYRARFRQ